MHLSSALISIAAAKEAFFSLESPSRSGVSPALDGIGHLLAEVFFFFFARPPLVISGFLPAPVKAQKSKKPRQSGFAIDAKGLYTRLHGMFPQQGGVSVQRVFAPWVSVKNVFFRPPMAMIPLIPTGSEISRQWWCWAKKPTNKKKPFHPEDNLLSLNWSRRCRWYDKHRIRKINKTLRFPRRIFLLQKWRTLRWWEKKNCCMKKKKKKKLILVWTWRTHWPTGFSGLLFATAEREAQLFTKGDWQMCAKKSLTGTTTRGAKPARTTSCIHCCLNIATHHYHYYYHHYYLIPSLYLHLYHE